MDAKPFIVAGELRTSADHEIVENPYSQEAIGRICLAGEQDIEDVLASSVKGFETMRAMPAYQRAEILSAMAELLRQRADEIALLIASEAGKPLEDARGEVARGILNCQNAAEESKRISGHEVPLEVDGAVSAYQAKGIDGATAPVGVGNRLALATRVPLGPILAVAPFNFPLNLALHKVAPAIAAGNSVVLKPPPQTPLTPLLLGKLLLEAGLPPEALSVVPCRNELAERMVRDDRLKMISFTGSAKVGWYLKSCADKKKVTLELGGNGGVIVDHTADLRHAAQRAARGAFVFAGQYCIGVQRILVDQSRYDEFVALFLGEVKRLNVGDPRDAKTDVGPVIDRQSVTRIESWIAEAKASGARVLHGGERDGNVISPTVLTDTTSDMKVESEEIFGPVATINPYREWTEGLAALNDSKYGLQLGVFTQDLGKALEAGQQLDAGAIIVNDAPIYRIDSMPFGGVKESGFGREGTKYAIESMTELKLLILNGAPSLSGLKAR